MSLHFLEDSNDMTIQKKRSSVDSNWAISFADIVTVLLCFFIIFYMLEKQLVKTTGFGTNSGTVVGYDQKFDTVEIKSLVETVESSNLATIHKSDEFLELRFPSEVFFNSGKTDLSKNGERIVNEIMPVLLDLGEKYKLQIQGHADKTPVKKVKSRWWKNNMELSIARALSVYNYLSNKNINKSKLSVVGFGTTQNYKEITSSDRRITFRIEPVDHEN